MDDTIDVKFGASTDGLAAGIKQASSSVASGVAEMSKGLLGLGNVVKGLAGAFAGLAAGFASGALFKAAMDESVQFGREVGNLSRQFSLTTGEASKLALAIDDAFLSTEEYQAIAGRLTRQLKSNEDALHNMGIATRDSKGALLDQNQLVFSALDGLRKYRAGTDQLAAAQVALGRGITEEVLQKLFDVQDAYAATKNKADEFGRVMGTENVAASMAYRRALDNVGDAFQGIRLVIGNALLPVWNQLMELFASAVGSVIPSLNAVMKALGVTLAFITELGYGLFQVFKVLFTNVGQFVGGLAAFLGQLAGGNWSGAVTAWRAMTEDMKGAWGEASDNIEERTKRLHKAMSDIWNGPEASAGGKASSGTDRSGTAGFSDPTGGAEDKRLQEFKRQLAMLKLGEDDYHEYSKEAEVEFWRSKLSLFARGSKDWQEANILYLTARRAAAKESVDIAKSEYDLQVAQAGNNEDQKVKLAEGWLNKMRMLYGADSQQYRAALKEKLNADMAYEVQRKQLVDIRAKALLDSQLAELDLSLEMIQARTDMGWMEKEEAIRLQREIVQARYDIQLADLERRRALYQDDVVQQEQIAAERMRLETELQAKLQGLNLTQQRTVFDTWSQMVNGLASTMEGVLYGLITKTMTWRGAMQSIVGSVLQMFIKLGMDKVKAWVLSESMMTAATKAWTAIRTALGMAGNSATVAAKSAEAGAVITANAGEAASGAAASQAAIPIAGPMLAAAAAAAMLALVLGFKNGGGGGGGGAPSPGTYSIPSAANGWWQVPGDLMAKIHEDEMVMPAPLAQGVRDMVENGGVGGGTVHIHATDADSVRNLFKRHADDLWDVMRGKAKGNPRF